MKSFAADILRIGKITGITFLITLVLLNINYVGLYAEEDPNLKKSVQIDRTDFPTLYYGQVLVVGESVWMLQARMRELGYDIEPNGVFDSSTETMVKFFQLAHNMNSNGIVDEKLWTEIMNLEIGEAVSVDINQEKTMDKMLIIIDIADLNLTLYNNGQEMLKFPIAVGKGSTPSPLGEWKIVQKSLNWGNGFGTRWLGLNVPWGIYGIHGTNKPGSIGSYASHGCIRMLNRDVEKLYPLVPTGTKVKIVEKGRMFPQDLRPRVLKKGNSGQNVVYIQSRLKELGIILDNADGRYGNATELAVKYFQAWHMLPVTGEMDETTYRMMDMIE